MLKMSVLYELGNAFKFHNNSHLTEKGTQSTRYNFWSSKHN